MPASTPVGKTRASTSLCVPVNKISVALATRYLNKVGLDFDLERVILQFNKSPAPTVKIERLAKVCDLSSILWNVCNTLAAIHEISMVGLNSAIPNSGLFNSNHDSTSVFGRTETAISQKISEQHQAPRLNPSQCRESENFGHQKIPKPHHRKSEQKRQSNHEKKSKHNSSQLIHYSYL
jgi:hypothetical protein